MEDRNQWWAGPPEVVRGCRGWAASTWPPRRRARGAGPGRGTSTSDRPWPRPWSFSRSAARTGPARSGRRSAWS